MLFSSDWDSTVQICVEVSVIMGKNVESITPWACQILTPIVIGREFPQYLNWTNAIYMLLDHRETLLITADAVWLNLLNTF